jgi:hypothetical protein
MNHHRPSRTWLLFLLGVVLTAAVVAGTAHGAQPTDQNTQVTPQLQPGESAGWTRVAGAQFPDTHVPPGSVTPYDSDLFAVSFHDPGHGYAGGAVCTDPAHRADPLDSCPLDHRMPVLYHYAAQGKGQAPTWSSVDLPGATSRGFVGAIAYIDASHILAVGGTGSFPRRELARQPGESDASYIARDEAGQEANAAGMARAWLYANGTWTELTGGLPRGMRGLSALAFSPRTGDCGAQAECGVAGGLRQLWMWRDGRFDAQAYSPERADANGNPAIDRAAEWRFRVRAVRFVPGAVSPASQIVAVTSGCCALNPADNTARVLIYDGHQWLVRLLYDYAGGYVSGVFTTEHTQTVPDSYYALLADSSALSIVTAAGAPASPTDPPPAVIGNVLLRPGQDPSTGLPGPAGKAPPSAISPLADVLDLAAPGTQTTDTNLFQEVAGTNASAVRLVAGDGDVAGPPDHAGGPPHAAPDHMIDWAVGSAQATGQGVAYSTFADPAGAGRAPSPVNCPQAIPGVGCTPANQGQLTGQAQSHAYFALPSYALNAFTTIGTTGGGWAAGDHGALMSLGGAASAGNAGESPPPVLGDHNATTTDDMSTFAAFAPIAAAPPGSVPPLASRQLDRLDPPTFRVTGSPDTTLPQKLLTQDVAAIAMSKDGSEGWAVGARKPPGADPSGLTTLYHYARSRWSACDMEGVPGIVAADPACSSLAPLARYVDSIHTYRPVVLFSITRIPTENGPDPSAGFDAMALGTQYRASAQDPERLVIARYHAGRWTLDREAMQQVTPNIAAGDLITDVAFLAPNDGWMITNNPTGASPVLYHFDGPTSTGGHGWQDCTGARTAPCDDLNAQLPPAGSPNTAKRPPPLHLANAGDRVYLYGGRQTADGTGSAPLILLHARGDCRRGGDSGCWRASDGGYDPLGGGAANPPTGAVTTLSVAPNGAGHPDGWALNVSGDNSSPQAATLLHLPGDGPGAGTWSAWATPDASSDYSLLGTSLDPSQPVHTSPGSSAAQLLTMAGGIGENRALLALTSEGTIGANPQGPLLSFDPTARRWGTEPTPFASNYTHKNHTGEVGIAKALADDGQGGAWLAARRGEPGLSSEAGSTWFLHYSDRAPRPVFDDVAHPILEQITGTAAAPDGTLWVSTKSAALYTYSRFLGWKRTLIPGWDPGQIVTAASEANAVAVGPTGEGVVVGKRGRIADISPGSVSLDFAAGVRCVDTGGKPPCGTAHDLRAAAVARDGSALVGGDTLALLWRGPGGQFHAVSPPPATPTATITGISLADPGHAYVVTDSGQVFSGQLQAEASGQLQAGAWSWQEEAIDANGDPLSKIPASNGQALALRAVAVDKSGDGFAVGDGGLVLQRNMGTWRRLPAAEVPRSDLTTVTLPAGGGSGALIGGENGLILTYGAGQLEVADAGNPWSGPAAAPRDQDASRIVGLALVPGYAPGEVEAWAALQVPTSSGQSRIPEPQALLHYSSVAGQTLLDPTHGVQPQPDAAAPRAGEISFAAFGKQDCSYPTGTICPEQTGTNFVDEMVGRKVASEIAGRAQRAGGPAFALFTGDASDAGGAEGPDPSVVPTNPPDSPTAASRVHRRWVEHLLRPLSIGGLPAFGAVGGQDLSRTPAGIGSNQPWALALGSRPSPWGQGGEEHRGSLVFRAVPGSAAPADGGARTHYAFDVIDTSHSDNKLLRVVVIDTSLRSVSAGEAQQRPAESQTTWLDQTLSARPSDEQAIVVSNTPSYSYGPGGTSDVLTDATTFESILTKDHVSAVVSGRLGWNGLYWATGPGLHSPCQGDSYPDPTTPPTAGSAPACQAAGATGAPTSPQQLSDALAQGGAPSPPSGDQAAGQNLSGVTPFVVAASAGGKFGPDGQSQGTAAQGYWHGFTVIRLGRSGDPRSTIVEQRPVFDWIGIVAQAHTVRPGQHVTLRGYGREPVGIDAPIRRDDITGPAITHWYDMVEADPQRPWLPRVACPAYPNSYCPLSPSVATINHQTGLVTTGRGNHPRVYALGLLSVGDKAASWPLVFEPRRSYVPVPPVITNVPAPPAVPQVHVAAIAATSPPPPPSAPPPAPPVVGTPTLPQLPGLPGLPPLNTPPPAAPPPPTGAPPPAPPASQAPSALSISVSPQSVGFAPPSGVVPPPAPPINPAPPGGARREAKAKQPAAAKSEEASSGEESQGSGGDLAGGPMSPPGAAMTRHHPDQRPLTFTALHHSSQPSAWSRGALYGGGVAVMALLLALMSTALPTPRRRAPTVGAPAWARRGPRRRG